MNPSWWLPIGILTVLCYLFYMLTIEFKLARLDDAVASPDTDVHSDLNIWSYEFYFPRVKARKVRAFLRWVGVSAAIMLICFLLSGGGSKVVKALSLPTPTQSTTPTRATTPTPLATVTPSVTNTAWVTSTPKLVTVTGTQRIYTPSANSSGSAGQVVVTRLVSSQVQVTRLVQVTRVVQVAVTRLVTVNPSQVATLTPEATQTPWIIYVMVTETPTEQAGETPTETPTLTETVIEVPSETPSPTETETPQVNP